MTPEQQIACGIELYGAVRDWVEADDIDGEGWREMTSAVRAFVAALDESKGEKSADLPPRWDGLPVAWSAWNPAILPTHTPLEVCGQCGRKRRDSQATGVIAPGRPSTRDGMPIFATSYSRTLVALRCPECGHTTVDHGLESYELDPEDYEPEGSFG